MKKISYVVAALATLAIGVPSIASAEDMKPGMTREGMKDGSRMHRRVHHHMYMDTRPHYHHHTMKKGMMKHEL
jgi:hypothetical protein